MHQGGGFSYGGEKKNIHGSHENLEAIEFLRQLNQVMFGYFPYALMEETADWPLVTRPAYDGGLENTSRKVSSGQLRQYFNGDELDTVAF